MSETTPISPRIPRACRALQPLMVGFLVAVAAPACETTGSNTWQNGGTAGGLGDNTGGSGQGAASTGGTAGATGGGAGGAQLSVNSCQTTVDEYCMGGPCPRSWPGADDLLSICPGLSYGRVFAVDCGSFLALVDAGTDTTVTYYYDPVTRQLTAIIFDYASGTAVTAIGPSCIAGPAGAKANSFPEFCPALSELVTCPP